MEEIAELWQYYAGISLSDPKIVLENLLTTGLMPFTGKSVKCMEKSLNNKRSEYFKELFLKIDLNSLIFC